MCRLFLVFDVGCYGSEANEKARCKGEPQDVSIKEDCDGFARMFCIPYIEESFWNKSSVDKE
jgi:hypothetical protein